LVLLSLSLYASLLLFKSLSLTILNTALPTTLTKLNVLNALMVLELIKLVWDVAHVKLNVLNAAKM